jgi:uncharacterized protein YoxC
MVTLDIEDTRIRMVVVEGKQVVKAANLPLEPGLIKDGVILDRTAVSQRIKELMAAYDVTDKKVIASISGIHSLYRLFTLPKLPRRMLAEAVRRQVTKVIPVPLNQIYTAWQAVDTAPSETTICMVGSPRSTVDAMWETLQQADLQPHLMDISPLALAKLPDEKDAIVVYVQPVGFDIVVMIDGIPRLLRSLSFLTQDMPVPDKVAAIKEELDRTVNFFKSSREGDLRMRNVPVFISGESRQILAGALDYPVKVLPEWFSYPESFDYGEYAVNIGLALKQVRGTRSQSRVNINAVPEAYLPKPRPIIELVSWAFIPVAIAILVPLVILTQQALSETMTLQTQVDNLQSQVDALQGTTAELVGLQANVQQATASLNVFKQPLGDFETQRAKVNGDLAKVTSLQPGVAALNSISYDASGKISVTGVAPDKAVILNYASALRDSGRFSQVLVQKMEEVDFNKWDFTLTLE